MEERLQTELLRSADIRLKSGDYDSALSIYNKLLSEDDSNPNIYFSLGNLFHRKGELGKAIRAFQKVVEISPAHTEASIALSVLLNDIGKYEEARLVFEKANKQVRSDSNGLSDPVINKKFSFKHYELAEMYFSYGRYEEAVFEYNRATKLDPENLEIRIKLSKGYAKRGLIVKAIEELKKLKNEKPNYIPARIALGLLYFENGNVIEARSQWKSVLSLNPANEEAKMYLSLSDAATETLM